MTAVKINTYYGWQCAIITLVINEAQHGKAFMNNWLKKKKETAVRGWQREKVNLSKHDGKKFLIDLKTTVRVHTHILRNCIFVIVFIQTCCCCCFFSFRKRNSSSRKDPQHRQLIFKNHAICSSLTFLLSKQMKTTKKKLNCDYIIITQ